MADYKGIKGFKVQSLASDPTLVEGQVWYNTTSDALKYQAQVGAWSSGGAMIVPRFAAANAKFGTQSAALTFGGESAAGPASSAASEAYDGTSWAADTAMNTARSELGGLGTQTAAIGFGGYVQETTTYQALTESWNGTAWTEVNNINTTRGEMGSTGTSTAGLSFGGYFPSHQTTGETWDGTCWSETGDLQASGYYFAGAGSSTAALATGAGGNPSRPNAATELYDGTSWAETGDLTSSRDNGAAFGTVNTAAIFCGGYRQPGNPPVAVSAETEEFNGTSWTALANMGTARKHDVGCGTTTLGLIDTGQPPACEEWTVANAAKTVTVS